MIIVGGCSYTDKSYYDFKVWPTILGEIKKCEVINTAKAGHGNRAIFHNTLQAIQNNLNKVEHVYIMWTAFDRQDFLTQPDWKTISVTTNDYDYTYEKANKLYNEFLSQDFPNLKQIINNNLNYIYAMQSICRDNFINYTFCQAMPLFTGNHIKHFSNDFKTQSKVVLSKEIINHVLTDKIKDFYGWPCVSEIGGFNIQDILNKEYGKKGWWISEDDSHPSEKAHTHIASNLLAFTI